MKFYGLASAIATLCCVVPTFGLACEPIHERYLAPEILLERVRAEGAEAVAGRAVRSGDFERFYFVQIEVRWPDGTVLYPMFAMNKPFDDTGVILSMDDIAVELTGFADGRETTAEFSWRDDGYAEANRCLK